MRASRGPWWVVCGPGRFLWWSWSGAARWCLDLALDGRGIQLSVCVGEDATRSLAYNSSNIRPSAALPERFVLVAIATEPACLCGNVSPITPD